MKTIKPIFLTLCLFVVTCLFVQAKPDHKSVIAREHIISQYIQCTTQGEVGGISQLLDENFKECMPLKGKTVIYSKEQVVSFLRSTKGLVQNCTTDYSWVESSDKVAIAKVEMKYPDFTRVDYITLNNIGGAWKVTHVAASYE